MTRRLRPNPRPTRSRSPKEICAILPLSRSIHPSTRNLGYGDNQKICYSRTNRLTRSPFTGTDIVVMLHPGHRCKPLLPIAHAYMIALSITLDAVHPDRFRLHHRAFRARPSDAAVRLPLA